MDGDETGRKKFGPDTQPMRCCTRATDCPVAARHGNAALWPSPWPRLCTYKKLFQSTVFNYLSRNPHIFCRLKLARNTRAILNLVCVCDSAASGAFTYLKFVD